MKKILSAVVASAGAACAMGAAPAVSVSDVRPDAEARTVEIAFALENEPGVVTLGVETNTMADGSGTWAAVDASRVRKVSGALNRKIDTGAHVAAWHADGEWAEGTFPAAFRVKLTAWATNAPPPYMLIDLSAPSPSEGTVRFFASEASLPYGCVTNSRVYKSDWLVMRKIPAAKVQWRMGAAIGEYGVYGGTGGGQRECNHQVVLSQDYYIAVFETTQRQFYYLAGWNATAFSGYGDSPFRPASSIAYQNIRGTTAQANWPTNGRDTIGPGSILKTARERTGVMLDLPTNAEWEFAARAGVGTSLFDGTNEAGWTYDSGVDRLAWYFANSTNALSGVIETHEVGLKPCNNFGLYDVLGNVDEWVLDWYEGAAAALAEDPRGPEATSGNRISRGGCFTSNTARQIRLAFINMNPPTSGWNGVGFRLWAPAVVP